MEDSAGLAEVAGETLTGRATERLHRAILSGELAPGSKLRIRDLTRAYGLGTTPIREGLSRLVGTGLVDAIGQRGFRVVPTSREDLEDIVRARCAIEVEALRLAMARGGDAWGAEIVACLYRLQSVQKRGRPRSAADIEAFEAAHRPFHAALIAACGSPRLLDLHRILYDQTLRYRRMMLSDTRVAQQPEHEHRELAELVLARDVDAACARLLAHIRSTLVNVYGVAETDRTGRGHGIASDNGPAKKRRRKDRRG